MTLAINGLIAKPDDTVTWSKELWPAYFKLVRGYDAVICGHKTFAIMLEEGELKKMGSPPVIVLTKRKRKRKLPNNCYAADTPQSAKRLLQKFGFESGLVVGGAKTVTAFIESTSFKNMIIDIEPQLYGQGLNLISTKKPWVKKLKLLSVRTIAKKIVRLTYRT